MICVIQINVNGIKGKFNKLHSLARDYNASVVVVCELKTSNFYAYDRAELDKLLGYTLYLESARCAVYVADALKKQVKQHAVGVDKQAEESKYPEEHFHCCAVSIADSRTHQKLLVVSCYRSPSATSSNTTDVFEAVSKIPGDFTHTIVAGDFNVHHARLGSQKTDVAGQMLLDYLEASSYHILNDGTPTRRQAVLDLTVSDLATVGCITKWKVMASPGLTDHNTITFHFEFPAPAQEDRASSRWRLRAPPEAWECFLNFTDDWIRFNPNRGANWNADQLTNQITKAAEWSIGRVTASGKPHPWWNDRLQHIKKQKRKLQRQLKKQQPEEYKKIRNEFNNLKHLLQRRITARKRLWRDRMNKTLMEGNLSSRKFWDLVRNPLQRRTNHIPTLNDDDGNVCQTTQQKLKVLADQFLNPPQPKELSVVEKTHHKEISSLTLRQLLDIAGKKIDTAHHILEQQITIDEVLKVVRDLKQNKAAGPDDLNNTLLKKLSRRAWLEVTKTFNACLREGVHPGHGTLRMSSQCPSRGRSSIIRRTTAR